MVKVTLEGKYTICAAPFSTAAWLISIESGSATPVGTVRYISGVLMFAHDVYCVGMRRHRVYWSPVDSTADRNTWLNSIVLKV